MPELISLKPMRYRHRLLRPGVPFSVPTDVEAALLMRARCAIDPALYEPEEGAMAAQEKPARPKLKRKPARYQRRDMRADD